MIPKLPVATVKSTNQQRAEPLDNNRNDNNASEQTVVSPLAEKNVRKAISRFGTMPKGARIGAYLESLRTDADGTNSDVEPETEAGICSLSDDSLETVPSSRGEEVPHADNPSPPQQKADRQERSSNEFLQQLKERLRKTGTREAADESEQKNLAKESLENSDPSGPTSVRKVANDRQTRKVDGGSQTDDSATGWKRPLRTVRASSERSGGSGSGARSAGTSPAVSDRGRTGRQSLLDRKRRENGLVQENSMQRSVIEEELQNKIRFAEGGNAFNLSQFSSDFC